MWSESLLSRPWLKCRSIIFTSIEHISVKFFSGCLCWLLYHWLELWFIIIVILKHIGSQFMPCIELRIYLLLHYFLLFIFLLKHVSLKTCSTSRIFLYGTPSSLSIHRGFNFLILLKHSHIQGLASSFIGSIVRIWFGDWSFIPNFRCHLEHCQSCCKVVLCWACHCFQQ